MVITDDANEQVQPTLRTKSGRYVECRDLTPMRLRGRRLHRLLSAGTGTAERQVPERHSPRFTRRAGHRFPASQRHYQEAFGAHPGTPGSRPHPRADSVPNVAGVGAARSARDLRAHRRQPGVAN